MPSTDDDLTIIVVSVLHALLRLFDWLLKLLYYLKCGQLNWTESQIKLSTGVKKHLEIAKDHVKLHIKENASIRVDVADSTGNNGNSNTGNVCHALLTKHRETLVASQDERHQEDVRELIQRLYIIYKVYSSTRNVDVPAFKKFCKDTYELILSRFDQDKKQWIDLSPTVHALIAHAWELIELNDSTGMGRYSEAGVEHNNKVLRLLRSRLARKKSQNDNLEDCITRLWVASDPCVRAAAPQPKCSRCTEGGHFTVSCPTKLREPRERKADDEYLDVLFAD